MLEWAEAAYKKKLRKRPDKEIQEKVPTNGPKYGEFGSHVERNVKKKSPPMEAGNSALTFIVKTFKVSINGANKVSTEQTG